MLSLVFGLLLISPVVLSHPILGPDALINPPPSVITSPSLDITWVDVATLGVGGRPFESNTANFTYARFPPEAQKDLNGGEWSWGLCSTGMFAQFSSNATSVHVQYTLRTAYPGNTAFTNFPPNGCSGVDLYARDTQSGGDWRWVATTFSGMESSTLNILQSPLWANNSGWPTPSPPGSPTQASTTQYRLHFPSYNGVMSMQIGVPQGASLLPDLSWNSSTTPPALYLGTSITQGGLTARPGQIYTSRLSRVLPAVVKNLGMCGSCHLELGLAKWVALAGPPSTLIIDCTANMNAAMVATNTGPFIQYLRASGGGWGSVPIVLVEPITYAPAWILGDVLNRTGLRVELRRVYEALVAGGDTHLTYVTTATLEAQADMNEQLTYEGVHPLDRGHSLIAEALAPILTPLMLAGGASLAATSHPPLSPPALTQEQGQEQQRALPPTPSYHLELGAQDPPPFPNSVWVNALSLTINSPFPATSPTPYNRLPAAAQGVVRQAVWDLSLDSAGITVSFTTDSPYLSVDLTCKDKFAPMPHFPTTGVSGLDLWVWDEATGHYRFAVPSNNDLDTNRLLHSVTPVGVNLTQVGGKRLRWVATLPTYNSVTNLSIGVAPGAFIGPDPLFDAPRAPIVWYGTSILQGGVSFMSGQIETWRVARALSRPVHNLGFSGNGKMETSVGQFLVTIPNPAAVIVDCSWNMDADSITAAAVPFVQYLRSHNVTAPIFLSEGLPFGRNWAVPEDEEAQTASNAALRAAFNTLSASDSNLHYMTTAELFSPASLEDTATSSGLHATDAGMHDMAAAWIKALAPVLK